MYNGTAYFNETELKLWTDFVEEVESETPRYLRLMLIVSMYIIFFVSIIGNGLTCFVIDRDKTMHTATNFYLYNLAVSDMIVSCAVLVEVHEHMLNFDIFSHYSYGGIVCKIYFVFVVALFNNGILIMTALAIERYLAICYPLVLKSKAVVRRVFKIIVLIWFIAILETIAEWWAVEVTITPKSSMCFTVPTKYARLLNGVMAVVGFVIPLSIMTFVYTMIVYEVRAAHRRGTNVKVFNQRDHRKKVHKLVVLTLSFLICWLPFFTMRMTIFFYDVREIVKMKLWWRTGYNLSTFTCWCSTAINPILFSLMSTKFRTSLGSLWKRNCKRQHIATRTSIV